MGPKTTVISFLVRAKNNFLNALNIVAEIKKVQSEESYLADNVELLFGQVEAETRFASFAQFNVRQPSLP